MKKFLFFGLMIGFSSLAQNTYFFDKKGKKTVMRDDTVEILVREERLSYAEDGKSWEKYIRFKDLDYAIIGSLLFKSFKLINPKGNTKKETGYFVMTETKEKKLLSYKYTVIGKYSSIDFYNIYVIDNNNNILDYVELNTSSIYTGARKKIAPFINKHFSNCPDLMEQFSVFEDTDDKHLNVLGFFDKPEYINCD
jgi:hypothetical protein